MNKVTINFDSITEEQKVGLRKLGLMEEEESDWYDPKEGEKYWIFLGEELFEGCHTNNLVDSKRFKRQEVFRTQEEAEKADQWRIALTSIRRYIAKNMPFTPDWNNFDQRKYFIVFDADEKKLSLDWLTTSNINPLNLYLASEKDAEKLIKDMESELKVLFEI